MEYASELLRDRQPLKTHESRLKVLYQVTKLIEVIKTRETVITHRNESSSPEGIADEHT